jgi:hypothetical protein
MYAARQRMFWAGFEQNKKSFRVEETDALHLSGV